MEEPLSAAEGRPASADSILFDAVTGGRDLFGDRTALVGDEGPQSYRQLAGRVESLATVLVEEGLAPGDRLALLCPNGPRFVEVLLAASRLGVAVVPLGHPAKQLGPSRRDPFAEHAHRDRYGSPWTT